MSPLPGVARRGTAGVYSYTPRLIPWLRAHGTSYDAVFVEGIWQYHDFAAWRVFPALGKAYHLFPHGMLDPWFKIRYPLKHIKKVLYWLPFEQHVLRRAASVIFTCEDERLRAAQSFRPYRCRERIATLGIAAPAGEPAALRERFLAEFPGLRERRLLLFLGRLHEKKGCDLLLRAFAEIARGTPDLHLVMAGPDHTGWRSTLEALAAELGIAESVTWPGMLQGDLKWGAYHAAEVFVLPSHQENFGVVVAEALACSLPVLISDQVAIWREVVADNAGMAERDDLPGTRQLLQRWIALPPAGQVAMRQHARRCFETRFEVEQAARMQLEIAAESSSS